MTPPAWSVWIATVGGAGRLPWAPGTWGSLAALPVAYLAHWGFGFSGLTIATLGATVIGYWASRAYLGPRQDDPKEVVIDEVAGQLLALWPLSFMLEYHGHPPHLFPWPGWVGAFVLFRLFDILKPPPIRWLDRPGAWGIMADDIAAGAMAGGVMFVAAGISHGWF